ENVCSSLTPRLWASRPKMPERSAIPESSDTASATRDAVPDARTRTQIISVVTCPPRHPPDWRVRVSGVRVVVGTAGEIDVRPGRPSAAAVGAGVGAGVATTATGADGCSGAFDW